MSIQADPRVPASLDELRSILDSLLMAAYVEVKSRDTNRVCVPPRENVRILLTSSEEEFNQGLEEETPYNDFKAAMWEEMSKHPVMERVFALSHSSRPYKTRISVRRAEQQVSDKGKEILRSLHIVAD
ncbi:MAG TPA: hypothetical protein VGQ87_00715 [Patescibacteria group bacterium]|jgi:hypothetical protein|nr:hypothetical protein [Patescibacteria group bacterium]